MLVVHHSDVLIIGAGGSGLSSAIYLNELLGNISISILCKTYAMGSHTTSAKGGINAALGNIHDDHISWHIHDTISSSKNLCDSVPTQKMCNEAPTVISFLERIGVEFDKTSNGKIDQRIYGGQTTDCGKGSLANRACFVKDHTGHAIMTALTTKIHTLPSVKIHNYIQAFKITSTNNHHTVMAYNIATGKIELHSARYIIFATGGFSQIYQTNSSSHLYTGCGHRILFEAGAKLKDIEMVQFHPTGIKGSGILISEACRSQGGYLLNSKGERFMKKYHHLKELAPRDVISNAIYNELQTGEVFLDLTHIPKEVIKEKLISSYNVAKHFAKIDLTTKPISIAPTAHYNMGGIMVDENYHIGNNIYAIGELACASVHGANRLGCNSLLELFTSAKFASQHIAQSFQQASFSGQEVTPPNKNSDISFIEIIKIKEQIQSTMENNASIVKNRKDMLTALKTVDGIYNRIKGLHNLKGIRFDESFIALVETQSLVLMAKCVLTSALFREHSIGAHTREDFPHPPKTPQHTILDNTFAVQYGNVS